jgi:hypothetical protein
VADFKTHITVSTTLGVGYAAVAYRHFDMPAPTCLLAGALCSVSGMLPDLDSDSGVPLRESLAFAAACVPAMLVPRWEGFGWPNEAIILAGAVIYVVVRFGLGTLLKKYTVHRGMFHSIPAALIAGEAAFLLCVTGDFRLRAYKAGAVLLGFFSHLILDEIWSVKMTGVRVELKSSSGTAMKLWSSSMWANISCYGKLALLSVLVFNDPIWATVSPEAERWHATASTIVQKVEDKTGGVKLPQNILARPTGTGAPNWYNVQGAKTAGQNGAVMPNGQPINNPQPTNGSQPINGGGVVNNGAVANNGFVNNSQQRGAPAYSSGYGPQVYQQFQQQQPYYGPPQYQQPQYQAPPQPYQQPQYYGQQNAVPPPTYGWPQPSQYPPQALPQNGPMNYGAPSYQPPQGWQAPPAATMPVDPRVQYGPMTKRY